MKNIKWPHLVESILDKLLLSQSELAELCEVSQQTISSWKKGYRTPGLYAKRKLLEIIENSKIDIPISHSTHIKLQEDEAPYFSSEIRSNEEENDLVKLLGSMSKGSQRELAEIIRRKRAEEELQKVHEENERIISSVPDALWSAEFNRKLEFKVLYVSPIIQKITGYPAEFFIKSMENWREIVFHKDIHIWDNAFDSLLSPLNLQMEKEYRIVSAAGDIIWLRNSIIINKRSLNEYSLDGIISDITDRKNAEEALKKSEQKYRSLLSNSPDGICIIQDSKIVLANSSLEKIIGYTEKELLDISISELVHPEDREMVLNRAERRLKGETLPPCYSFRLITKDGKAKWIQKTAAVIEWDSKPALIDFISDISENKRTADALKESEARNNALLKAIPDFMFLQDLEGNYLDYIANNRKLLPMHPKIFIGKNMRDILPPDIAAEFRESFEKVIRTGKIQVREYPASMAGKKYFFEARIVKCDENKILTIVRDITSRKNAEQLRENINAIIHHDLKGPLNSVVGMPAILLEHLKDVLTSSQRKMLKSIEDSGHQMVNTINLSLATYKMEQGIFELTPDHVNVNSIIRKILSDLSSIKRHKKLSVEVFINGKEAKDTDEIMMLAEEFLLYSMMENLVRNAMEASLESGSKKNKISVHNSLPVPEKVRDVFFEKHSTYGKKNGTGLGTYSAKLVAEAHSGNISMETSDEKGTIVTVLLPA
jgi:PAS domain S-box-containing protein